MKDRGTHVTPSPPRKYVTDYYTYINRSIRMSTFSVQSQFSYAFVSAKDTLEFFRAFFKTVFLFTYTNCTCKTRVGVTETIPILLKYNRHYNERYTFVFEYIFSNLHRSSVSLDSSTFILP